MLYDHDKPYDHENWIDLRNHSTWHYSVGVEPLIRRAALEGILDEESYLEKEHRLYDQDRIDLAFMRFFHRTGRVLTPASLPGNWQHLPPWALHQPIHELPLHNTILHRLQIRSLMTIGHFAQAAGSLSSMALLAKFGMSASEMAQLTAIIFHVVEGGPEGWRWTMKPLFDEHVLSAPPGSMLHSGATGSFWDAGDARGINHHDGAMNIGLAIDMVDAPPFKKSAIFKRRIGWQGDEPGLADIGNEQGLTRERIRQIVSRMGSMLLRNDRVNFKQRMQLKIAHALHGRALPLPVRELRLHHPWFSGDYGVAVQGDSVTHDPQGKTLALILRNLDREVGGIAEVFDATVYSPDRSTIAMRSNLPCLVSRFDETPNQKPQISWPQIEDRANESIEQAVNGNGTDQSSGVNLLAAYADAMRPRHVHHAATAWSELPFTMGGKISSDLVRRFVLANRKNAKKRDVDLMVIRIIHTLEMSDTPMHIDDLIEMARKSGHTYGASRNVWHIIEEISAAGAINFGQSTYGVFKHMGLLVREFDLVKEKAHTIIDGMSRDRPIHVNEVQSALIADEELSFLLLVRKNLRYIVCHAMSLHPDLKSIKKMLFVRASEGAAKPARIADIVANILKQAGRKMRRQEIVKEIQKTRGVGHFFQIYPSDEIVYLGDATWIHAEHLGCPT